MDATRITNGRFVCIKRLHTDSNELGIAKLVYAEERARNARNHCVSILDTFEDEADPSILYLIMPFMRPIDRPPLSWLATLWILWMKLWRYVLTELIRTLLPDSRY